jgi:hypothetical protein
MSTRKPKKTSKSPTRQQPNGHPEIDSSVINEALAKLIQQPRHSVVQNAMEQDSRRFSVMSRPSVTSQSLSPSRRMSRYQRPSVAGSSNYLYGSMQGRAGKETNFENTYRLGPSDWERFSPNRAEAIIEQVLQSYLDGESYDAMKCGQMSLHLSEIIKERIKSDLSNPPPNILEKAPKVRTEDGKIVRQIHPRYRVVCAVVIGQLSGQSLRYASRCMWDPSRDSYASGSFQNSSLFATATVFAVYYD